MKYDIRQKPSKFAERVLADFSSTLFSLLQGKTLKSITVNELCEQARYPRATFYNYFDDIYDLLSYAWIRVNCTFPAQENIEELLLSYVQSVKPFQKLNAI